MPNVPFQSADTRKKKKKKEQRNLRSENAKSCHENTEDINKIESLPINNDK